MLAPITHQAAPIRILEHPSDNPFAWLDLFDPQAAYDAVIAHVEPLPGSRFERHTMRAYLSSLADFCAFLGAVVTRHSDEHYTFIWDYMRMPSRPAVQEYIAASVRRGLSSSTIARYMAAVRLWVKALEEQPVTPRSGSDFMFILEAQRQFRLAVATKNPASETTSNRPALEQYGTRLTLAQVNHLFETFKDELHTLTAQRDIALLYLGITSGLRAAEIARITPGSITAGSDCFEIRVRGKRGNRDPIGIDSTAHTLITNYITAWNDRLDDADPRRIVQDTPVFQPILRGDHIPADGLRGYHASKGMTSRAILQLVLRRTKAALGSAITAHDMRRTCAYLMREHGYEWDTIRSQLRHRSIATTEKYVGRGLDLSRALLSKRAQITIPTG